MKETTKMSRAVSQLEHIYNNLNADFFAGELPVPIITVQSKPGTYGHCTTAKVWQRKDGGAYELNIAAEAHGLTCIPCGQYGWNTTPGENLVEYALSKNWNEIKIGRSSLPPFIRTGAAEGTTQAGASTLPGGKRPSSTRKLVCSQCGQSVRATKKVNILCGDCMMQMVETE